MPRLTLYSHSTDCWRSQRIGHPCKCNYSLGFVSKKSLKALLGEVTDISQSLECAYLQKDTGANKLGKLAFLQSGKAGLNNILVEMHFPERILFFIAGFLFY